MNRRRIGAYGLALAGAMALAAAAAHGAGIYVNMTASAPTGIWRVHSIEQSTVRRGMMVSICPPALQLVAVMQERGYLAPGDCPTTNATALLKPVVAIPGDTVSISSRGVTVNGQQLANSRPQPGIPAYPTGTYRVKAGELWIVSSFSGKSFDSRYYGPVPLENLRGQATPIAVSGDLSRMSIKGEFQ